MKVIYTDSLVIGGGLAGLRIAIATKARGLDTIVLSLIPAKRSHSAAAQGGMQASLATSVKSEGDNEDVHFGDTVKGSDWGCDQAVARMFANTAPKAIRELSIWGVPFTIGGVFLVLHGVSFIGFMFALGGLMLDRLDGKMATGLPPFVPPEGATGFKRHWAELNHPGPTDMGKWLDALTDKIKRGLGYVEEK